MSALHTHIWGESAAQDRVWAQVSGLRPALRGRRLFMVLQAYVDDSVGDDGTFVLAAYVASAEQWAEFSREWEELLPYATKNKRGIYRFKMSDMARSPDGMSRVGAFHNIIGRHVQLSFSMVINKNDLERARERIHVAYPPNHGIDWLILSRPLGFLFYQFLTHFHYGRQLKPEVFQLDEPVDFYFDDTSEKHLIMSEWDYFINTVPPERKLLYGVTPRFENDEIFLPLQAADFLAWWVRKWAMEHGLENVSSGIYEFESTANPILNLTLPMNEDYIAGTLKAFGESQLPDFVIEDRKPATPAERVDPPFPAERLASFLKGWFRRTFAKGPASD